MQNTQWPQLIEIMSIEMGARHDNKKMRLQRHTVKRRQQRQQQQQTYYTHYTYIKYER